MLKDVINDSTELRSSLALLDEAQVLVLEVGEDGQELLRLAEEKTDVLLKFA